MKTIREIADEIGVSKQAVFKKIKREPLSTSLQGLTSTVDGRLMVSVDGENLIKSAFLPSVPSTDHQQVDGAVDGLADASSTEVDGLIVVLQATIDTLQGQLEVKDRQIEQLTSALVAAQQTAATAQALHAGTMKQLLSEEDEAVSPERESMLKRFSQLFRR
ncbi:hypothetical protein [uncultured Bacteroides sp.]|uniref:hypothetical protein n=1 Tax=uncultured Bacteroides sp. TaxID=162156 RepID=UPI00259478CB|nr:hypothetical protein [uncultured Bacteroides sp.]